MGVKGNTELFGDGVLYENVWDEPKAFRGQTGAQDDIIPMQDILELDTKSRMNIPGTVYGNWKYKMCSDDFESENFVKLKKLCEIYGR